MKRIIIFVLLFAAVLAVAQQPTTTPSFTGMISYNLGTANVSNPTYYGSWIANRFKYINAPPQSPNIGAYFDFTPYLGVNNIYETYVDSCSIYVPGLYVWLYGTSTANPWITCPECMLLHYTIDELQAGMYIGADQFDIYEQSAGVWGGKGLTTSSVRGVFKLTGSVYADVTQAVYSGGTTVISDHILIGNGIPFDIVNFNITNGATQSVTYQYWNGSSFVTLTPSTDTTNGLTVTGTNTLTFVPPADWSRYVINASQSKYWIQATVTGGTGPTIATIKGDNLLTPTFASSGNVTSVVPSGSTATYTVTTAPTYMQIGNIATFSGVGLGEYNGSFPVTAFSAANKTITVSGTFDANSSSGGTATYIWNATRGWQGCVGTNDSGGANLNDPELAYCGSPGAGHTAKFRQQARVMGYSQPNRFYLNPSNKQSKAGVMTLTVPYQLQLRASTSLYWTGINSVMFDNFGRLPDPPAVPNGYNGTPVNTDFDTATYQVLGVPDWTLATAATMTATHDLINGSLYDIGNAAAPFLNPPGYPHYLDNSTTLSGFGSEGGVATRGLLFAPSADQLNVCSKVEWCPQGVGSHNMVMSNMIVDNINKNLKDSSGNYHVWDGGDRRPMLTLSAYWTMRTNNVALVYNTMGFNYYGVGDDYYYYKLNNATLSGTGLNAQICGGVACTFTISQPLGDICSTWEVMCVVRIGGDDIVPVVVGTRDVVTGIYSFPTGLTLTVLSAANDPVGITRNHYANETIETVMNGHQSQDIPLHTPIHLWGSWFPAMGFDLGTPSNANGFAYPCSGTQLGTTGTPNTGTTCYWKTGAEISSYGCIVKCSPLMRRDFISPTYGNVIVLMRLSDVSNNAIASAEFETYSSPICLSGGTSPSCTGASYYPLHADGTFGALTNATTLRGGEGGIYTQYNGLGFFSFK